MQWNIELQVMTNPLGGGSDEIGDGDDEMRKIFDQTPVDATSDSGAAYLGDKLGIKVKTRTPRPS